MAKKQVPVVVPVSPLKAIVDKIADKADKTLGYSEEVVNKVGAGQEAQYTGLQSVYKQKEANFFDPYEDYVDRNTLHGGQFSVEDLNKIRATNQSNWEQAGHAVGRVAVNIVPQIIGGISSMVDIPGYFSAEAAAQNKLVNWAQDLKKEVDEDWFPIYEENPGQSMSMSDPAWWMSRGSGLVESVGAFLVQGMVGRKLVSTGLKGLGAIGGKKLAQTIIGAQKSKQFAGAGGALLNATMLNQAESVIDATQVFNDTYKQRLKEGYDTPKAKKAAAEAASMTMNLNKINILLNLSSAAAFLKPLGGRRNILKATSGIGKLVELGKESGQEGLEELVNLVAQKSGEAKGKGKDYTLQNALQDIGSMEGLESAFLGAIGGLAQTGATKASEYSKYGAGNTLDENGNRISNVTYEKGKYAEQQAVIKDLKDRGVNVTDVMKNFKDNLLFQEKLFKAQEKGDTAEVERLKEELFETQAIKAFQSGTTEVLENLYQAEAEKDPAEVGQEHIAKATDAIVQLKELEKVYNNFEDYANVDEIFFNRANKNRVERNLKYVEIVQKQADLQLNKDLHTIAKKYSYDREREVLIKKDGKVVEVDKKIDKIPLSYSATNLEDNQGHTEAEQAVYNKFLEEVQALPSYKAAESNREELDKMNNVLLNSDKEFATITSKEYQIKAEERKIAAATLKEAYATISSTNSIAEVEKLKETIADPAFKKAADAKIADLKTTNDIVAKQKQVDLTVSQMQQKIKTATLENIQELREEVENAELSEKHKTNLSQALDKQANKLNGIVETEEDAEEDNPLAAFDAKDPAELANEVAAENASFETNLPKDLPNPNTETEDVEQGVADAATKLATEDKTMIIGEDSQGNLVYGYSRSSEGHNRAAFLSREFNQTEVTGRIDRDEIENSLDNLELLDPDFLNAGTALNMQIDAEYEGDKYDPTSNTRQKTPWSLREAELRNQAEAQGIPLTSLPAYIAEVPIKVTTENGDTVFYVHDNAWYKEENLSATAEEIAEDKAKNYKIREAIVKKGTPVKTKVSYKSFGKLFKTFDGNSMPVAEAMPDPNLIFAVGRNGTFELPGDASIILKGGTLLKSTAAEGRVYAIVKVGPKEYLPIPLERKPISQEVIDSVMFAIEAHLTGDPENAVVIAIAEKSGLDITTNAGLTKYINQFMYLFPTKGKAGLENYLIAGGEGTTLKSNMPLISVTATGIEFGRPGVNMGSYTKPDGTKVVRRAIVLSQNFKSKVGTATNAAGLETLRNLLQDFRYTPLSYTSRKDLSSDADSTLILDADGATKTQKYSEQVKQSLETNILSVNIGTEEDPNWVYTIQPTILFDTAFAGIKEVKKAAVSIPKVQKTAQSNKKALEYKGVNPTVDLIVTRIVNGETQVLLIKRGDNVEAEAGKLTFPGGFQDTAAKKGNKWKPGKETAEEAAIRELKEETGLDLNKSSLPLLLLNVGTFNDQARDPRNSATSWVSSTVFRVTLPENFDVSTEVSGKDDAKDAQWIPVSELSTTDKSQFGFDHATILESEGLVSFKEAVSIQTVETLRAEEQVELAKAIPNIANYPDTYGEKQGNMPDDLYAIYKPIYDKYNKLITALSSSKPTAEEQVEELTGDARIEAYAQDIIGSGQTLTAIESTLENFDLGAIPLQVVIDAKFSSLEEAKAAFAKAKEIFIANAKESKTITLPNGLTIKVDKNTLDTNAISDDEIDELIPEMTEEQLTAQKNEIDEMIVRGLDTATQSSLISYLSADIITQTLAVKEVDGKQTVKVKPILDKHLEALKELSKFYKEQGLDNKAARLDAIVDQFDKVRRLVNQNMSKFSTGGVSEDVELDSNEEVSGLVRTNYTDDWAFTVSSKSTASGDLKKFFSIIQAQDEDGPMVNILGLPEIISYDTVYDTLHEILANKPADFGLMLDILELNIEKFPWIKSVITQLESAPEKIQNEFVSDMTKHHINMQFIMWSKDYKGNYSLQKWSSNSSSTEQRLRSIWNSNLKGVATQSNLIAVDEDDEYVFNKNVGDSLINQAKEWAKNPAEVTNDELATWLGNFGIVLTDKTYEDLRKGRFNNQGKKSWNALFTHGAGIVRALSKSLDDVIKGEINFQDAELLNDSSVKALAKLDASNNLNTFSNSFQAGGKTIFSYGNNNFLVNRMRDLTVYNDEDGTFVNPELIDSLKAISFTKNSTWLAELTDTGAAGKAMRNNFRVNYLSLEALKKAFTKSQDNRKLNNLTTTEHEVAKIAFFQNVSGDTINGEDRRIVDFFYPTMSDKTSMLTISTLARKLVLENGQLSSQNLELLYETLVTPEINRIRDNQATNIKGYEPNYFYFLHSLNNLMITTGTDEAGTPIQKSFLDIVKDKDDYIYSEEVKTAVLEEVRNTFNTLIENKLADWEKLGIGKIITDDKGRVTDNFSFLDKEYMSKVANNGIGAARTRYAAMDYVFNYLIANAEAHKLFAGDPALYAKFKKGKTLQENLEETFINIGKRLAGDIAPGMELANSANNKYYQIFLEDQEMESNNVKDSAQKEYFSKIIKDFAKNYSGIEGSDAQEYTTWKEHLYVMKQLGRLTKAQYEACYKKLEAQSRGDFRESNKLTFKEIGMIMQPMKPVYVGNIASVEDNADRRIYIKSSSFPLLPELTAGMQMDKIRKGLETFESKIGSRVTADGTPAFVRASFGTANKVGAIKNAAKIFNKDGNVVDNLVFSEDNALLLSRQNFRIQQDVPYSREKASVNIGTQERKLLFVNTLDLEIEPGVKGEDLMALYNQNYEELYQYAHENLSKKLGLIQEITTKNDLTSLLELPFSEGITAGIFERVSELEEQVKAASPVKTVELYQDFADEVGDNTLERVNFINKNFDSIVESLVTAKPEIFKDENNEFKKCE
jgi:ADP-ribose pyrophosphatase YjhB (NUDIX family)